MSKAHWLALSAVSGIGGATAKRIMERFGSIEAALEAPAEELCQIPRITPGLVQQLKRLSLDALEEELSTLADEGIEVFTWDDEGYPANLRQIDSPPPVLFAKGQLVPADAQAIAIVGTRQPSGEGIETAQSLARELAARGIAIISGLALGIDTAAHQGALEAEDGRTVAVLGCGVRHVHPRSNAALARQITGQGALVSELHPSAPVLGRNLMARDRIISGLSRVVVVAEAGLKSGSLDTAERAHSQGRIVYAIPGSEGTDDLLARGPKKGARRLVLEATMLDELAEAARAPVVPAGEEPRQPALW